MVPLIFNVILGIVFYKKQLKIKKPVWTYRTDRLIGKREIFEENMPIFCNKDGLCNVSITKVLFFNYGSETIKKEDVKKHIRVNFPKDNIIIGQPKILQSSRPEIYLTTTKHDNEIILNFDFLDQEDGCLIEVVHSSPKKHKQAILPFTGRTSPDYTKNTNEFLEYNFIKRNATVLVHAEHLEQLYLFSWNDVPGNDGRRLLSNLKHNYGVSWAEGAEIHKSDNDKTIHILNNENSSEIMIEKKGDKATLTIGEDKTYELEIKKEKGKLNIYEQPIKIDGIILGVSKGIQLINVREKGARIRIIISSLLFIISCYFVVVTAVALVLFTEFKIYPQEFISIIILHISQPIFPILFIVPFMFACIPFVYIVSRHIASIVTFPSWFDYKYQ